jgi:hypothetical protein
VDDDEGEANTLPKLEGEQEAGTSCYTYEEPGSDMYGFDWEAYKQRCLQQAASEASDPDSNGGEDEVEDGV